MTLTIEADKVVENGSKLFTPQNKWIVNWILFSIGTASYAGLIMFNLYLKGVKG